MIIKSLLTAFLFFVFGHCLVAQETRDREYFLQKSEKQKKVAWIMAGSGVGLFIIGNLILTRKKESGSNSGVFGPESSSGILVSGIGILSALGSIPVFISASGNKKKAFRIGTGSSKITTPPVSGKYTMKRLPTVKLTLNF